VSLTQLNPLIKVSLTQLNPLIKVSLTQLNPLIKVSLTQLNPFINAKRKAYINYSKNLKTKVCKNNKTRT
jgi:hypothetical protein